MQVHQTKYLLDIGFSPGVAAWALGVVSLLGIPGQILLGHLSDRVGREWIWTASCLGFAICFAALIALAYCSDLPLLYVMVAAQGALGYGVTSIMGAVVLEIFEGKHYGSIFGTLMLAALAGGAAGPWVTGILHDIYGNYTLAFAIGIGVSALSAVTIWLAAPAQGEGGRGPVAPLACRHARGRTAVTPGALAVSANLRYYRRPLPKLPRRGFKPRPEHDPRCEANMNELAQTANTEPLFNPLSPDYIRDPYPSYERLRTTDPMHLTPFGAYVASRHAEVSLVLRDKRFGKDFVERSSRRYGPQIMEEPVFRNMRHWMLQQDPPDHTRLRGLVVKAFTARRVEDMRPRIQQIVDETLDRIVGQGHMDLIEDFAFRLPVTIICDMLGIPEDHREVFYSSSRDGGRLLDPVPLSRAEIDAGNAGN